MKILNDKFLPWIFLTVSFIIGTITMFTNFYIGLILALSFVVVMNYTIEIHNDTIDSVNNQ